MKEVVEELLTVNPYSRPQRPLKAVKGVVIHYTGNAGASAEANRRYFESLKDQNKLWASAHYIVGINGEIIHCVPDNEMAYHAGAKKYRAEALKRLSTYPNDSALGIELCIDRNGQFTEATLQSGRELAGRLLAEHGLTRDDLWRHFDITGKVCPKPFLDRKNGGVDSGEAAWEAFKAGVEARAE
jgi:N-acetylmuramoyl-L-alanine amidase